MNTTCYSLKNINIEKVEIAELLGFGNSIPEPFSQYFDEVSAELKPICNCEIFFLEKLELKLISNDSIFIQSVLFKTGKKITSILNGASTAILALCTTGLQTEIYRNQLNSKENFEKVYIADIFINLILTKCLGLFLSEKRIEYETKRQYLSIPLSPGNCEWDLVEQKKIFSFFVANNCSVKLTESGAMFPTKSLSVVIGIGENIDNTYTSPCQICSQKNCYAELKT